MTTNSLLISTLKSHGYSTTKPREAVFMALEKHGLITMSQLVDLCEDIDRASVYRTTDLFKKLNIIHRVNQGFKYRIELSEPFTPHHHHISCMKCGKKADISQESLEVMLKEIASLHGFALTSHTVELNGICKLCS